MSRGGRAALFLAAGGIGLAVLAVAYLGLGPQGTWLAPGTVLRALLTGPTTPAEGVAQEQLFVWVVRMPRLVTALAAGASFALAGAVMQAVFRNPLASPEVMGTTAGAALGAVLVIASGLAFATAVAVPAGAFVAAVLVSVLVFVVASAGGSTTLTAILLAGVAMNALLGAATAFVTSMFYGNFALSGPILFWLMGGLDSRLPVHAWTTLCGFLGFAALLAPFVRDMDLLTLEEEGAAALGVDVARLRKVLLVAACGMTATAVACVGGVAFVGLVVPHLVRLLVGPAHRVLLPCAALAGALLLAGADLVCRVVETEQELRVGIVTSALGAPFFLVLLARHRRGGRA
ncbi:MAG: iron ABC transporter permease [Planctomycetes bacterium]|nr:iron ABC transporter permease [Planctomycetota bacterium]